MAKLNLFIPINKIDEEQRLVYGTAAAEEMDNSGEIFDYEGSKPFFQKWSDNAHATSQGKSYGNIRVMHTSKVAGLVASPLGFDDENKRIEACAKVIDDDEWKKVLTGCYTGFSMGGRYVSRITKGDEKRYIADPVEISLVDKPCIASATFNVIKADGIVETHHFDDSVVEKTDTGGADMPMTVEYVPTNDETLPVARELAKADGKPETAWFEYMDAARAQLIAANPSSVNKADDAPVHTDEDCKVEDCAKCADASAEKGDNPFAKEGEEQADDDEASEEEDDDAKAKKAKEDEEAEKSDTPELEQGWKAKDGTFFLKKADALAHNETLTKADVEPSLADQLRAATATAESIAKGEHVGGEGEDGSDGDDGSVTKADFEIVLDQLDAIIKVDNGGNDALAKSMYNVSRTADLLRSLASLNISVSREAKQEGDGSTLSGQIGIAVGQMGDVLIAMAKEEVEELMASIAKEEMKEVALPYYDDYYELAASTLGLEKSDAIDKAKDMLAKRDPVIAVTDSPETLQKMAAAEQRAERLEAEVAEITPLVKGLVLQIEELKKMPMPKAPTTSIAKGDAPDNSVASAPIDLTKFDPSQLAEAAIRLSHQHGRTIGFPVAGQQ